MTHAYSVEKRIKAGSANSTSESNVQRRREAVYWNYFYKKKKVMKTNVVHKLTGTSWHVTIRFRDKAIATQKETLDGFESMNIIWGEDGYRPNSSKNVRKKPYAKENL